MKDQKGITLISLIIYIILMTFVVAGVTSITASFRSNINEYDTTAESAVEFSKFNMYLLNDIKGKNVKIYGTVNEREFQLQYDNGDGKYTYVKYSMQNNAIYRNSVKVCDNVRLASFSGGGKSLTVSMQINKYTKTTTYAIESKI